MINRTRPYSYSFRVSEKEKGILEEKVKGSKLSRTDYLIKVLTGKEIICIPHGTELLYELKRQGNNLNQAVKNVYIGKETEGELKKAAEECKKAYRKLISALGGG